MADKSFHLEIITPRRVVFKGEVTRFSAPGAAGGFQVLHSHAPLLSSLKIGEVKITDVSCAEFHYAVSGGFAEVRAKAARDRAQKRIAEKKSEIDFERAKFALYRALNRLKIVGTV